MNKRILTTLILLFSTLVVAAQTGTIRGQILDAKTKEAVIGASISVTGTTLGALADIDGNFEITRVPAGKHSLKISFIGYSDNVLKSIDVFGGQTTLVNAVLAEDNQVLQEVVVKAQRLTFSDVSVITEIKQAEGVAVGISAEQIGKTQDRDAAQVIRRVPGVTIYDDRFVNIRGLNERYNTVMLNDAISPSTEVDTRAFSFNLIPSGAIDRMIVFKSPSADLPGDFSGGVIKLYTKTVPDGDRLEVNFQTSYRQGTTFQQVTDYRGGRFDWLGFDDGTRRLPATFPTTNQILTNPTSPENLKAFQNLNNFYSPIIATALPDMRAGLLYTKRMKFGFGDFTNFTSINYTQTNQAFQNQPVLFNRYLFDPNQPAENEFSDLNFQANSRLGIMANFALLLNNRNKIEFRNLFNQLANKSTVSRGGRTENVAAIAGNSFEFTSRSIYSGQLSGKHDLNDNTEVNWNAGFGYTNRLEPDTRRLLISKPFGSNDFQLNIPVQRSPSLEQSSRFFSTLNEYVGMASGSFEKKFGKEQFNNERIKLKTGFYAEAKSRDFAARWFGYVNPLNNPTRGSLEKVFSPTAISGDNIYLNEGTNFDDKYGALNYNGAAYVQGTYPIGQFKATAGVRGEYNQQELNSFRRGSGQPLNVNLSRFNILPSVNVSYNFSEKSLVRAGYGKTLNRPEFRELAPFTYYDFNMNASKTGNPNLVNATVDNIDVRYELYPTQGELISVGVFYKRFVNPIEQVIRYSGSGVNFSFANADHADSRGVEVEIRKNFDKMFTNRILKHMNFLLNASFIQSNVKASSITSNFGERQLQGQSPYIINTGLFYNHKGFQANVIYNLIGPRIVYVGDRNKANTNGLYPDQYELPRHLLDLSVSKAFGAWELKAGVQDLLNNPYRVYQDTNLDGKIGSGLVKGQDDMIQTYRLGSYYTVGITYKIK